MAGTLLLVMRVIHAVVPTHGILTPDYPNYQLTVQSNPTTGYIWLVKSYDKNLLKLIKHEYVPSTNPKLIGAPGQDIYEFQGITENVHAPTMTSIHLVYARPWDVVAGTAEGVDHTFFVVLMPKEKKP